MPDQRRRTAIYARFSTDLQSDRSIDDQVALCRSYAAREGLTVVLVHGDRARTSASLIGRDGIQDVMAAARGGAFDVLLVEAFDRISRDQEDLAGVHKRLAFLGIAIHTVNDGRADSVSIGVHGLLGQLWMDGHKKKIRRGQSGVIRDGRSAGGRAYGYRPILGRPGELAIVAEEAAVIRRIFEAYVDGSTPREIARQLNAEGVPPPRGIRWNGSTINGNVSRQQGLLINQIYAGTIVWNRVTSISDPDTGRRALRVNPEADWQRVEAPHLAIVSAELFEAAGARKEARARLGGPGAAGRAFARPLRPLSGLLRCGCCGGGMAISKSRRAATWIRCSTRKESGACTNMREPRLDRIEAAIFERLAEELDDPSYVRAYVAAYREERRQLRSTAKSERDELARAAVRAREAFERAHRLYVQGVTDGPEAEVAIHRMQAEMRAAAAAATAASEDDQLVELHPAALTRYAAAIADLRSNLAPFGLVSDRAIMVLRELVSTVTVTPAIDHFDVKVDGYLAAVLGECRGTVVPQMRHGHSPTFPLFAIAI